MLFSNVFTLQSNPFDFLSFNSESRLGVLLNYSGEERGNYFLGFIIFYNRHCFHLFISSGQIFQASQQFVIDSFVSCIR